MTALEPNPQSAIRNPQSGGEVVVSVRGLTKVFKDFWNRPKARAVDGVDFEVRKGEIFGLLGPNGSGKSTTIKLLLGLLNPTKGHIEVFGHSPRHVQTKARIGYLPEESYLYRYLNSRETLDFFGNLFHLSKADRDNRAEQLLEMVGLGKTQTRAVGEFSKGMQRRIGLAQALINDPDLIILDEPTAGLDPIGCREVKDLIVALATVAIFSFVYSWNDFLTPLIYLNDSTKYTLALGLQTFTTMYGSYYNLMMAASTILLLPILLVFFFGQRFFIEGVATSGLKG